MPKMKTNRGAAKRLRRTGKGKIKRMRAYKSHILNKKSTKRKNHLWYRMFYDAKYRRKSSKIKK